MRPHVLFVFLAGALTLLDIAAAPANVPKPNVIIIFADDLGYGDLGAFGSKNNPTPNLDRMAREGRKLTNFHVAQPVCSASRAALLTGCYPNRIGIHGALGPQAKHGLAAAETTIAEMFKAQGYATGMAGKWHLGHHKEFLPTHHGFDEYHGIPYSNDMWPHHPEAKPGTYPPLPLFEGNTIAKADVTPDDQRQFTAAFADRCTSFIARNKEKPFFFYLAHPQPHVPLYAGARFEGKTKAGLYADVIAEIDWSVGQILAALKEHNLDEQTLVIFTSDNGPWLSYGNHAGSSGPFREGKGTVWEGGTRVPFIARWPSKIAPAQTSGAVMSAIDILPSLATLIGAPLPSHKIDGRNALPLLLGEGDPAPHQEAYAWYYLQNELQAVTSGDGRWKLILPHTYRTLGGQPGGTNGIPTRYKQVKLTEPELYDLNTDPHEKENVAAQNPQTVRALQAKAEACRAELGDSLTKRTGSAIRPAGRLPNAEL